ncbi:MAG: glycosyltransferase family 1 protein [Acidobacteria bacterium]|nr:glycosyltransferase family 1 protein [Acidobacteriota bacterium]
MALKNHENFNQQPKLSVLCFCHLRWDFVYQRPQHLLSRCQSLAQVHLWEDPVFAGVQQPELKQTIATEGVRVLTPLIPHGTNADEAQRTLLNNYIQQQGLDSFIAWYYTPMALRFSDHLLPEIVVYDCMDELSAFQGAPPELIAEEQRLFDHADVVFAGGASLYESKRVRHGNVHLYPSSIDFNHFCAARTIQDEPEDQNAIPHPRIGFYGVLDERLDRDLLREIAALRPDWHFIMIGPVVKIREEDLPRAANIHYLGQKSYRELPQYLATWDVAMLPFARNASTRFISPTKTPEYLAAGKPVVSTPIRDVVNIYGEKGLVLIGETPEEFVSAIDAALQNNNEQWKQTVDTFLSETSWDKTFHGMWNEIVRCLQAEELETPLTTHS